MRIITRFKRWRERNRWEREPKQVRFITRDNFGHSMMFEVLLRSFDGAMDLRLLKYKEPITVPPGWAVATVRQPALLHGQWGEEGSPVASSKRGKELRGEVAGIRNKLASLKNIMEETDTIAAFVAQALRKFNEMVGLFPDFGFYSTKDKVYFRMDGKNYEVTIKEQELS